MKKFLLLFSIALISFSAYSQRWLVPTLVDYNYQYKKHYSHTIEGGIEDGRYMQYIAGNKTDWGVQNTNVTGHKFNEIVALSCIDISVAAQNNNVHFTDFTVYPTKDPRYGAGTGIYYPNGATSHGYPFFGLYDKGTSQIISAVYYQIEYPGTQETTHATGLKIKYSERDGSYFISGIMIDRRFSDLDLNHLDVKSRGFILKVDRYGNNPRYLEFIPDNLPSDPLLCSVTDIEISPEGDRVAFTGINSEYDMDRFHHPMAGMIDLDLNLIWCHVYKRPEERFSGVDIEFRDSENKLLVLLNSTKTPFSVMEIDYNGVLTQPATIIDLIDPNYGNKGISRAHSLHSIGREIIITGNCFVKGASSEEQLLFSYKINDANNLASGNSYFESFSRELVPPGQQKEVTAYWAPENSIYQNENLFLTGVFNNMEQTPPVYGFSFINRNGIDPECVERGHISHWEVETDHMHKNAVLRDCRLWEFPTKIHECTPKHEIECSMNKSSNSSDDNLFNNETKLVFNEINTKGINATITSEVDANYQVSVYDVLGREMSNQTITMEAGQKSIQLQFKVEPKVYIIKISNGTHQETLKILGK